MRLDRRDRIDSARRRTPRLFSGARVKAIPLIEPRGRRERQQRFCRREAPSGAGRWRSWWGIGGRNPDEHGPTREGTRRLRRRNRGGRCEHPWNPHPWRGLQGHGSRGTLRRVARRARRGPGGTHGVRGFRWGGGRSCGSRRRCRCAHFGNRVCDPREQRVHDRRQARNRRRSSEINGRRNAHRGSSGTQDVPGCARHSLRGCAGRVEGDPSDNRGATCTERDRHDPDVSDRFRSSFNLVATPHSHLTWLKSCSVLQGSVPGPTQSHTPDRARFKPSSARNLSHSMLGVLKLPEWAPGAGWTPDVVSSTGS
jgi:hypothetical protein